MFYKIIKGFASRPEVIYLLNSLNSGEEHTIRTVFLGITMPAKTV